MDKKRTATSENVYQQLKEQILHLELLPGDSLSEIETAAQYHVSRTPVRDAFKALENEGLLRIQSHIGTFVSLIDLNQISDILYIRESLEQSVLKDLALSFTPSHLLKFRLYLENQKNLILNEKDEKILGRAFIRSDNEFHAALFDLAGRKNVWNFLLSSNQQYERFRTFLNVGQKEKIIKLYEEHTQLLDAISNKEFESLQHLITEHIYGGFNKSSQIICNFPSYFQLNNENFH